MKHFRNFFISFIAFLLLMSPLTKLCVAAQMPEQTSQTVYIRDFANVLSDELESSIDEQSAALDALTGAQFMVVTVEFLGGETIRNYAANLFSQLQLGDKLKNNGILLLLATGEDNYYILQGQGLETVLSDAFLADMLQQNLEPDFLAEQYQAGVKKTYSGLLVALEDIYGIGDNGVLAAAAEAKAEETRLINAEKQKRILLMSAGTTLIIITILLFAAQTAAARRRKIRRKTAERRRSGELLR